MSFRSHAHFICTPPHLLFFTRAVRIPSIIGILSTLVLFDAGHRAVAQSSMAEDQNPSAYSLRVSVDEVSLTFHAADAHGLPVNDLRVNELSLLDNGKPPRKILAYYPLLDVPIRAGILMDTSESMRGDLPADRAIAARYAQQMLRQNSDHAFIMTFGYISAIPQLWTSDPAALEASIRNITAGRQNPLGGTALFDVLFRACFYQFGKIYHEASGNFILLFSDGEDNTSHTSLDEAVDICQRSNTAIYAFRMPIEPDVSSTGPRTLAELASRSGGRVFYSDDSEAAIDGDLHTIEADLRNQYRLVYKPAELRHDGSFHHIELQPPDRVRNISIRSGYYAPAH